MARPMRIENPIVLFRLKVVAEDGEYLSLDEAEDQATEWLKEDPERYPILSSQEWQPHVCTRNTLNEPDVALVYFSLW